MGNQTAALVRGADVLVATLASAGVKHIFALSGNQIMSIFDACIDADIEIIHMRHEAAAVYMAEAYAQVSGKPGVALVTAGAGLGNAVGALFGASESQTSVLLISGDSPVSLDGKGAFQELDQVSVTQAVTRWSNRVTAFESITTSVEYALRIASTPLPGPAHLAMPVDVLKQRGLVPTVKPLPEISIKQESIQPISDVLSGSRRPLIICGPALSNTRQPGLLKRLTQTTGIPAVVMESPRGVNDPALGAVTLLLQQADLIVCLGKRIDFSVQFGEQSVCDWIVVSGSDAYLQQATNNLDAKLVTTVQADPVTAAEYLCDAIEPQADAEWRERAQELVARRTEPSSVNSGLISPAQLCSEVQKVIDQSHHPVLICDGGEFGQWAQACLSANRRVINGLSGSIGAGVCYGIGAATALPESTVFVLTGDGSLGFHLAEIETAFRNNVSMVIVVGNDKRWNAEHQLQLREFGNDRRYACDLSDMQYHEAVRAMGGHGEVVTRIEELQSAMKRAVDSNMVACVNVQIEGEAAPLVE